MRVCIYARYSSDKQREASIEDQVRLCEERAAREGWKVANAIRIMRSPARAWCAPASRR